MDRRSPSVASRQSDRSSVWTSRVTPRSDMSGAGGGGRTPRATDSGAASQVRSPSVGACGTGSGGVPLRSWRGTALQESLRPSFVSPARLPSFGRVEKNRRRPLRPSYRRRPTGILTAAEVTTCRAFDWTRPWQSRSGGGACRRWDSFTGVHSASRPARETCCPRRAASREPHVQPDGAGSQRGSQRGSRAPSRQLRAILGAAVAQRLNERADCRRPFL